MNQHPTEKRSLSKGEEIVESWPKGWSNSPILIVTTQKTRGIGILWVFFTWGEQYLQVFWPRFFRLIFRRGFTLVLYDDLFFSLDSDGFLCGFLKPRKTWRRISPYW